MYIIKYLLLSILCCLFAGCGIKEHTFSLNKTQKEFLYYLIDDYLSPELKIKDNTITNWNLYLKTINLDGSTQKEDILTYNNLVKYSKEIPNIFLEPIETIITSKEDVEFLRKQNPNFSYSLSSMLEEPDNFLDSLDYEQLEYHSKLKVISISSPMCNRDGNFCYSAIANQESKQIALRVFKRNNAITWNIVGVYSIDNSLYR